MCKFCQVKDRPCIRCNKKEYTPGKITEHGPVCNSCSKYFRPYRNCTQCSKLSYDVSNRTISDVETKLLCSSCYNKSLPTCSKCHKQRKAFSFDANKPICKICTAEGTRVCKQCSKEFPAGRGRICSDCSYKNTLDRKVTFATQSLSTFMSEEFLGFSNWLEKRRGLLFPTIHIQKYYAYFFDLDQLTQELNRYPTYEEVVANFTVARTRQNLLVTLFLDEIKLIIVDKKVKVEYANIDMIDRYLKVFGQDTVNEKYIRRYAEYLHDKLKRNKTTVRSIRLALTPAIKLLQYSEQYEGIGLNSKILQAYLWVYSGQMSAVTGFVNFLNRSYKFDLVLVRRRIALSRPKASRLQLKQKLIALLRKPQANAKYKGVLLKVYIEYAHQVRIPEDVKLLVSEIKKVRGDSYVRLAGREFYVSLFVSS